MPGNDGLDRATHLRGVDWTRQAEPDRIIVDRGVPGKAFAKNTAALARMKPARDPNGGRGNAGWAEARDAAPPTAQPPAGRADRPGARASPLLRDRVPQRSLDATLQLKQHSVDFFVGHLFHDRQNVVVYDDRTWQRPGRPEPFPSKVLVRLSAGHTVRGSGAPKSIDCWVFEERIHRDRSPEAALEAILFLSSSAISEFETEIEEPPVRFDLGVPRGPAKNHGQGPRRNVDSLSFRSSIGVSAMRANRSGSCAGTSAGRGVPATSRRSGGTKGSLRASSSQPIGRTAMVVAGDAAKLAQEVHPCFRRNGSHARDRSSSAPPARLPP